VVCCRVFISGQITTNGTTTNSLQRLQQQQQRQMARPSLAPSHLSSSSSSPSVAADTGHPAPLFLRHVVNRRFKYRWLILALSGFTCMSIIVVLSVVYSNWAIWLTNYIAIISSHALWTQSTRSLRSSARMGPGREENDGLPVRLIKLKPLASPAMGHWGTWPLDFKQYFSAYFRTAQSL